MQLQHFAWLWTLTKCHEAKGHIQRLVERILPKLRILKIPHVIQLILTQILIWMVRALPDPLLKMQAIWILGFTWSFMLLFCGSHCIQSYTSCTPMRHQNISKRFVLPKHTDVTYYIDCLFWSPSSQDSKAKRALDAKLRRLCERKTNDKLNVPEWLHEKWANSKGDRLQMALDYAKSGFNKVPFVCFSCQVTK